jgi:maltose O-acetyltransferase
MVLLQWPRVALYRMISGGRVSGRPLRYQPLQTAGHGTITFAGTVAIGVFPSPYFLSSYAYIEARHGGARVSIGDQTWINNGFTAVAEHHSIDIGRRVRIGTNVEVFDSDFHGLAPTERGVSRAEWAKAVVIEDDVFLGSNVKVLKGVTIGKGSVVANGSIVVKDIPAGVIAGGNPARVIRAIEA